MWFYVILRGLTWLTYTQSLTYLFSFPLCPLFILVCPTLSPFCPVFTLSCPVFSSIRPVLLVRYLLVIFFLLVLFLSLSCSFLLHTSVPFLLSTRFSFLLKRSPFLPLLLTFTQNLVSLGQWWTLYFSPTEAVSLFLSLYLRLHKNRDGSRHLFCLFL